MNSNPIPHPETGASPRPKAASVEAGSSKPGTGSQTRPSLSRRDRVLLPLIAVTTVLVISIASETIARRAFPDSTESPLDCMVLNDPATGVRGLPNTVCRIRLAEDPMVEYRFNRCGHRAGIECEPAPPGVLRVVLVGSSTTGGYGVPREESFPALLPGLLTQRTGRAVQVYNAGIEYSTPLAIDLQFQRTLALKPDIILWPITTAEFSHVVNTTLTRRKRSPGDLPSVVALVSEAYSKEGLASAIGVAMADPFLLVMNSRTVFMVRHFLYMSESLYEHNARMKPEQVNFLRVHPDQASLKQMELFARYASEIEAKSKAAHVPIVVTMLPLRLQASMISLHNGPPDFDPYQPARFTRSVVESNGGIFVDGLPAFENIPSPGRYFYPVDTHPNAQGHALFASVLANALTCGAVPGLATRKDSAHAPESQPVAIHSQP
jgi:hypothetical protein